MIAWLDNFSVEFKAVVLGVIEGATEFLPVSSTGHLILLGEALNFSKEFAPIFDISIQMGAILAVISFYRYDFKQMLVKKDINLLFCISAAFVPVGIIGFLFGKQIIESLFLPFPVAIAFIVGGIFILYIEREYERNSHKIKVLEIDDIDLSLAFKIGLIQILSLVPGTSRSGAVIVGAMFFGFSRHAATKFSFFLALPVIISAGMYSLYLSSTELTIDDLPIFLLGFISAFISASFVIKWLIGFVQTRSLRIFGYYRIFVGILILLLLS